MSTVAEMISSVARGCRDSLLGSGDPRFAIATKESIVHSFNKAQYDFVRRTGCITDEYSFPLVANEWEYPFNDNCIRPIEIFFNNQKVWSVIDRDLKASMRYDTAGYCSRKYTVLKGKNNNGVLRISPVPSASSASSTLNGGIDSDDVAVVVDDITKFPYSVCEIGIGTESLAIIARNATTSTLTVSSRGRGYQNTTAASHLDEAVVTLLEMKVVHIRRPSDLSVDSLNDVPEIPVEYHAALESYAMYEILLPIDPSNAREHKNEYERLVHECKGEYVGSNDDLDLQTANLLWGNLGPPVRNSHTYEGTSGWSL